MLHLPQKRTRSGLIVSSHVREQAVLLISVGVAFGLSPIVIAIGREAYLKEDHAYFVLGYCSLELLVFVISQILWIRMGQRLFQVYVRKGSEGAKLSRRLNKLALIVPVAAHLYILGFPSLLGTVLQMLPNFGHALRVLITNAVTCAVSGIIGNFAYDVVKRKSARHGNS